MDAPSTIPNWIRELRAVGYTNPWEILDLPSIYGTEGLCGDWNGEILVLAKDFAPVEHVRRVATSHGGQLAWRHNDGDGRYTGGILTNRRLMVSLFGDPTLIDGRAAKTCNVVYGSACFFLKSGEEMSDSLRAWKRGGDAFESSLKVLDHVIAMMQNLKMIVCLGMDALKLVASKFQFPVDKDLPSSVGRRLHGRPLVYVVPHPAARRMEDLKRTAWTFVRDDSGFAWIGQSLPVR